MHWKEIINFWFEEIDSAKHWVKDPEFDQLLRDRFGEIHAAASKCELYHWRTDPNGRLAEIIVLDQFSRNMFRDTPQSFAHDPLALALAQEAVAAGAHNEVNPDHKSFMLMPYMHSESAAIHEIAVELFGELGNLDFELKHKAIIDRFGRYPHRNIVLGRESTAEELEFLTGPDSSF